MFKNATFLPFYFADNQLFSNSETLVFNSGRTKQSRESKKLENCYRLATSRWLNTFKIPY
jgi:hypothetical protein